LDEYEHALRHALPEYPCTLISEIHNALIFAIKERGTPPTKHAAVISLMEDSGEMDESEEQQDGLLGAMADFGNEWDKKVLKEKDGRKGWEEVLIGLLKDVSRACNQSGIDELIVT
jgi:bromodomain adjacent to zinc finger domain protein 1A